jgi:hypothetical protein
MLPRFKLRRRCVVSFVTMLERSFAGHVLPKTAAALCPAGPQFFSDYRHDASAVTTAQPPRSFCPG